METMIASYKVQSKRKTNNKNNKQVFFLYLNVKKAIRCKIFFKKKNLNRYQAEQNQNGNRSISQIFFLWFFITKQWCWWIHVIFFENEKGAKEKSFLKSAVVFQCCHCFLSFFLL